MAREITVNRKDDFDRTPATDTFVVTDAGKAMTYTIDLNRQHAGELRAALAPYLAVAFDRQKAKTDPAGTPVKKPRKAKTNRAAAMRRSRGGSYNPPDQGAMRAWARANGYDVKPIGNLPKTVRDAYQEAKQSA